jgi:homoserine kinase
MNFEIISEKVTDWAKARQIIPNSTPMAQAIKTTEEVAELLKALSKKDLKEAEDAYGDILVTLVIGASLANLNLIKCFNSAYEVIKDRKGYLSSDGIFIKEK